MDRNGNGKIDDGSELFGSSTIKTDGKRAINGFDALFDLDGGPGRSDHQIDARDDAYSRVLLWLDRNHNAVSDQGELLTLQQAGVRTIFTDYRDGPRVDKEGNKYRYVGDSLVVKNKQESDRTIFDVYLATLARP